MVRVSATDTGQTEGFSKAAPQQPYSEPRIIVDGETLKAVDDYPYLGSTVSPSVHIDSEVGTNASPKPAHHSDV